MTSNKNLGIYIHIPFCLSKCSYCNFVSRPDGNAVMENYISRLTDEINADVAAGFFGKRYKADSVYIGGGTPSVLPAGQITKIFAALKGVYAAQSEITIEINPGTLTAELADEYAVCGINRASLGLQTDRDDLLKKIGRPHTYRMFVSAVDMLRAAGIANVSADIMLGLPGQTVNDVSNTLDKIIPLGLKHISAYALKTEEGTPLYEVDKYTVDEDLCAEMYDALCGMLKVAGYRRYEVSNFAIDGYESRHNLKYWRLGEYKGYGVAAHSYINGARFFNTSDIDAYIEGDIGVTAEDSDIAEEMLMLNIRTAEGLNLSVYEEATGINLSYEKEKEIAELLCGGFVSTDNGFLRLTDKGFYVMNAVIVKLLTLD